MLTTPSSMSPPLSPPPRAEPLAIPPSAKPPGSPPMEQLPSSPPKPQSSSPPPCLQFSSSLPRAWVPTASRKSPPPSAQPSSPCLLWNPQYVKCTTAFATAERAIATLLASALLKPVSSSTSVTTAAPSAPQSVLLPNVLHPCPARRTPVASCQPAITPPSLMEVALVLRPLSSAMPTHAAQPARPTGYWAHSAEPVPSRPSKALTTPHSPVETTPALRPSLPGTWPCAEQLVYRSVRTPSAQPAPLQSSKVTTTASSPAEVAPALCPPESPMISYEAQPLVPRPTALPCGHPQEASPRPVASTGAPPHTERESTGNAVGGAIDEQGPEVIDLCSPNTGLGYEDVVDLMQLPIDEDETGEAGEENVTRPSESKEMSVSIRMFTK